MNSKPRSHNDSLIIAKRYAKALYELAEEQKTIDVVNGYFDDLSSAIEESKDIRRLIVSPIIKKEGKRKALDEINKKLKAPQSCVNFIGVLTQNNRLNLISEIMDAFKALVNNSRGIALVEVTSAITLDEDQKNNLAKSVLATLGSKPQIEYNIDPSIIGRLTIRVGSRMIDSSIKSKLTRLKIAMQKT